MFQQIPKRDNAFTKTLATFELIYHLTVRQIRKNHGNAMIGLGVEIMQSVVLLAVFYLMFSFLGMRSAGLRGDFTLYLMSGIMLFMAHNRAMGAIVSAESATSQMMKHKSLNSVVVIVSAALGSLYLQILSAIVILLGVHVVFQPVIIDDPIGALLMLILAWFSGACIGMVVRALMPWAPGFFRIVNQIYMRMNMIASGKMFVANTLPATMLPFFTWNPLFHAIDQTRGYVFINYFPRNTDWTYIIWFSFVFLMLGMLGEHYTRKHASISLATRG